MSRRRGTLDSIEISSLGPGGVGRDFIKRHIVL